MALDLTEAFDHVRHDANLNNLIGLHVGLKMYESVLADRTTKLVVGGMESATISLGNRGIPQGSVLSPFLFNVALIKLPHLFSTMPHAHRSLYADHITIWTAGGSDAHIEDRLQQAVDIVGTYAGERGLVCSPRKSQLLIYRRKEEMPLPRLSSPPQRLKPS